MASSGKRFASNEILMSSSTSGFRQIDPSSLPYRLPFDRERHLTGEGCGWEENLMWACREDRKKRLSNLLLLARLRRWRKSKIALKFLEVSMDAKRFKWTAVDYLNRWDKALEKAERGMIRKQ